MSRLGPRWAHLHLKRAKVVHLYIPKKTNLLLTTQARRSPEVDLIVLFGNILHLNSAALGGPGSPCVWL